jgi:lysophospholipase L1-like esterase
VVPGTNTVIPSTLDQLNEYLKSRPTQSKLSTTLFAIQIGGNDITVNTRAKASDTLVAVKTMITTLRSKGASVS